ncbi:MAG: hypothetical protein EBT86_07585 [Actinobacteria bacterium]|nr:hypothetical protein [Actinomycetota bacterium]
MFHGLSESDKRKHIQTVLTAISSMDNGEVVRWYSDDSYNHGIVEIVATSRLSGKLCRRVYSSIITEKIRDDVEYWACMSRDGTWHFHKN